MIVVNVRTSRTSIDRLEPISLSWAQGAFESPRPDQFTSRCRSVKMNVDDRPGSDSTQIFPPALPHNPLTNRQADAGCPRIAVRVIA